MPDPKAFLTNQTAAADFAKAFIEPYLTPAFRAMSKAEIDFLVFSSLIKAGAIDPKGPLYDIARALNITPAKARGLVMNWWLRSTPPGADLRADLLDVLRKIEFSTDGTLMTFGVENPLLREEIVARLKRRGVFADASFAPDLVRLPVGAFVEFLDDIVSDDVKQAVVQALVRDKQLPDTSFKAVAIGVLKTVGTAVAGEAAGEVLKTVGDKAATKIITPAIDKLTSFLSGLLFGDAKKAVEKIEKTDIPAGA